MLIVNPYESLAKVYSWNGTSWSQLGNDIEGQTPSNYSLGGVDQQISIAIDSSGNNIAFGDTWYGNSDGYFVSYNWDGNNWNLREYTYSNGQMLGSALDMNNSGDIIIVRSTSFVSVINGMAIIGNMVKI